MKKETILTRREFLGNTGVAALGLTLPAFLGHTALAVGKSAGWEPGSAAALPGFLDDHVLVVIQLSGGNDGLNTVIPHSDDNYYKLRPRLALRGQIRVNDEIALNNDLAPLRGLWDAGNMAVIEGVGYPNPDRSHFRSMEIWHTGSDSDVYEYSGWIGRYFDNSCQGRPQSTAGVYLGNELPQAFFGDKGMGVSFSSPEDFGYVAGDKGDDSRSFRRINSTSLATPNESLDFLRHMTEGAMSSADRVHEIAKLSKNEIRYPDTPLARSLSTVARLISGGLGTRLYYASHGGFDTHANQLGQQERLLRQWSEAVAAFMTDLSRLKQTRRVVVMTFSEFGRRVEENASGGTDHGTAAPVFLIGEPVRGGLHGARPSLTDLDAGDLKFTTDFRSVYASVLDQWFAGDPKVVLGREFDRLPLIG